MLHSYSHIVLSLWWIWFYQSSERSHSSTAFVETEALHRDPFLMTSTHFSGSEAKFNLLGFEMPLLTLQIASFPLICPAFFLLFHINLMFSFPPVTRRRNTFFFHFLDLLTWKIISGQPVKIIAVRILKSSNLVLKPLFTKQKAQEGSAVTDDPSIVAAELQHIGTVGKWVQWMNSVRGKKTKRSSYVICPFY